ncbi:MAG: hypothetical protein FJ255_05540 [Phycisphaerae bacterium]|nr:hypothetical protein [Phycisphaerae bacterium]
MSSVRVRILVWGVGLSLTCLPVSAAGPDNDTASRSAIERAVAEMNAQALRAAPADPFVQETGAWAPPALPGPAAWTVAGGADGPGIDVAVLGASTAAQVQDVVNSLTGDARIASVTGIITTTLTPTLAQLQEFGAVLTYTNSTPLSSVALGDVLADYIDGGGGVVLTMFGIRASIATRTYEGRFLSSNYYCIERSVGSSTTGAATLGTLHVPASPLLANVNTFHGGSSSFRSPAPLHANSTLIADWSTGQPLIAQRTDLASPRVDLNFFAVSQVNSGTSWLTSTDGAMLLRNAVVFVAGPLTPPCPGTGSGACSRADWNEDGVIDFNDFLSFLNDFNAQIGCADLNQDGVVDFNDFLEFLNLYNVGC